MGAGKSSLVLRFVKGQFFEYQESTIGAAFLTQTVATSDATVKFEIWDTAGQERYHSLAPMYYRGAAAAIIVYDITSQASYARAKTWVRELQRQGNADLVMALAGNKSDMADERQVTAEEASAYAEENGLSEELVQTYEQVFSMLDIDGGGTIEEEELRLGLKSVGKNPSPKALREMMSVVDGEEMCSSHLSREGFNIIFVVAQMTGPGRSTWRSSWSS